MNLSLLRKMIDQAHEECLEEVSRADVEGSPAMAVDAFARSLINVIDHYIDEGWGDGSEAWEKRR